jgi:hypothetical protein
LPTIQLEKETVRMLSEIQKEMKAKSIDEIIQRLITERKKVPSSMFGSSPNLTSMTEDDRLDTREL